MPANPAAARGLEEQFRAFFEAMDQGCVLVDVIVDEHDVAIDLLYVEANAAAVAMAGTALVGRRTRELSPDYEAHWFEMFGRVARSGVGERHELSAGPPGAWYDVRVFKVGAPDTRRVAAVYQDITNRKRADDELEKRVTERTADIKVLLQQLMTVQEEERRRIARNIHDHLGQQMTALRLQLEGLEKGGKARQLAARLDESIDLLTWELQPETLEGLGLADALGNLVSSWTERVQIALAFQVNGAMGLRLPKDVETNLFRLAQEALHNIHKHSDARHVSVVLEVSGGRVLLVIEDDGRGFEQPAARRDAVSGGLGLISMRERAALVGGELEIESVVGRGTTLRVVVPLPPAAP